MPSESAGTIRIGMLFSAFAWPELEHAVHKQAIRSETKSALSLW